MRVMKWSLRMSRRVTELLHLITHFSRANFTQTADALHTTPIVSVFETQTPQICHYEMLSEFFYRLD